ncbi:phosphatidylserine decarboxylase-domain-containing protein [Cyathus striatus]|nr:phosphatidylserine decarboxylase-domain-containing protein [Cyathus striatus]
MYRFLASTAPSFGSVATPVYVILAQTINADKGFDAYRVEFNKHFQAMLKAWENYLSSEASCEVLNDSTGGWFSQEALAAYVEHFNGKSFFDVSVSENNPENYYGFKSYDDFFSRRLRPSVRILEFPDDSMIINAPCEWVLYNIGWNITAKSKLLLKGQSYTFEQLLNGQFVDIFVGGTAYQGFLPPTSYHGWHSPVTGTIRKVQTVAGSYFSQSADDVISPSDISNPYMGHFPFVPTRQLIFINSDNPAIGLICYIAIGMGEAESCTLDSKVREGAHTGKGEDIGMFHFGGSSHIVVFGPNVKI